jgi:hypothetical protein
MVTVLCIETCCWFNQRFPQLRRLWLLLWRMAIRYALRS